MRNITLRRRDVLKIGVLASAALLSPLSRAHARMKPPPTDASAEMFVGPFASWTNLKTKYDAKGDGIADDTHALQAALDELGNADTSPVLWIPEGIYRITKTLTWIRTIGDGWMSILGEHPATTKMIWGGARDEIMFKTHNINNSRFGRITWDGQQRASCAIQHTSSGSSSGNEHADEFFENVGIGIRGGTMDTKMVAEMSVLRCHFSSCARAGISVENPNSVDWWIWYALFENCYVGVTSAYGQGSFHVFSSAFKRSTFADTFIGFASYYVLADNYSIHSRAFCLAPFSWNPLELVIQRNTILDPTLGANPPEPRGGGLSETFPYELRGPIAVKYYGPLLLLDNVIRSRANQNAPVIEIGEDMIAVGNSFSIDNALQAGKRILEFDNTRTADSLKISEPVLPHPPSRFAGKIFEVPQNADATQIQTQINAASKNETRAVVHIPHGTYLLNQSLVIPAHSTLELVGDGRTILEWNGAQDGIALQVLGPVHVTLRDIVIRQNENRATGLQITHFDQHAARVLMQGVQVRGSTHGLNVDGLDNAIVELRDSQSTNAFFDTPSAPTHAAIHVRGGAKRARGEMTTGRVNWFSGASSGSVPTFGVEREGVLLARAIWYEGRASHIARLDDAGEFTLFGALLARYGETKNPSPAIEIENFRGRVALLSTLFVDTENFEPEVTAFRVTGQESKMRVMLMGACGWMKRLLQIENNSRAGQVGFLMNRSAQKVGDYVIARVDEYRGTESEPYANFVREMLEHARREKPMPLTALPKSVTDMQLYRVYVYGFNTAIHLNGQAK